jgi:signal transduction histidine kinase
MNVAWTVRGACALYAAVLAGVLVVHVRAIRRDAVRAHDLSAISSRLRSVTVVQPERLTDIESSAEKFLVTRDTGYQRKLTRAVAAFGDELRRLKTLSLTSEEAEQHDALSAYWRAVAVDARAVGPFGDAGEPVARLARSVEAARVATERLAEASHAAMARELARADDAARSAARLSWLVTAGALLLGVVIAAGIVRAIVRPIERLAAGTREIAAGGFNHRVPTHGSDELAQLARDFNAMAEELQQIDRLKSDFVSNISHDLKTPLSSMQESTAALLDGLAGSLTPKQRQLLLLNQDCGRRLSSMIAKLLELARLESGVGPGQPFENVDVMRVVRGAVERASAHARNVAIGFEEGGRLRLRADPDGLSRLLDNLLENAIKFSPADGTVRVALAARGRALELAVSDSGPGIPDQEKERVFERFYQTADGRAARAHGVGLGLAICRHIVAAHGGAIRVDDNVPRGAVFTVTLPGLIEASALRGTAADVLAGSLA